MICHVIREVREDEVIRLIQLDNKRSTTKIMVY